VAELEIQGHEVALRGTGRTANCALQSHRVQTEQEGGVEGTSKSLHVVGQ